MEETKNTVAEQIWCYRNDANMTQMELSLALGYKTNVINLIENRKTDPTIDLLTKLNHHFGWEFTINNK